MLAFTPSGYGVDGALAYRATSAGGESNVAVTAAAHGRTAAWISRVGDDRAGRHILDELSTRGVDTSLVVVDRDAPTGLMLKEPSVAGTTVHYYRSGSAASFMAPGLVGSGTLDASRVVHVTGVTPALSATCAAMVTDLVESARRQETMVSFDVNFRPRLWTGDDAPVVLARLARQSDVCFVGRDESESLWGTTTPESIRAYVPEPRLLVVKDGAVGATVFSAGNPAVFVPAPDVDVVEPVGAGDAFAGAFLAGLLESAGLERCLRLGHSAAARALCSLDDLPVRIGVNH